MKGKKKNKSKGISKLNSFIVGLSDASRILSPGFGDRLRVYLQLSDDPVFNNCLAEISIKI